MASKEAGGRKLAGNKALVMVERKGCPPVPGRESSARPARRPSVTRRPFAFLSVAVFMACLFHGLSAEAQLHLSFTGELTFVTDYLGRVNLPGASGGTPPYTYSLSESGEASLPPGLSFNPATRRLEGRLLGSDQWGADPERCPDPVNEEGFPCLDSTFDYTVTDSRAGTPRRHTIKINYVLRDFGSRDDFLPGSDLYFAPNVPIGNDVFLEQQVDRGVTYTYHLTGPWPPGLDFDANTRQLSGTPTRAGNWLVVYSATTQDYSPPSPPRAVFTSGSPGWPCPPRVL